jgi:uncharacterized protein
VNIGLAIAGLIVGFVVGLTGMGGGALMTPILVLFFNVNAFAAVSSDLVAAAVMKPFGGTVHLRNGTVNFSLVRWLCIGSIPTAFAGVFLLNSFSDRKQASEFIKLGLGVTLVLAAAALIVKSYLTLVERTRRQGQDGLTKAPPSLRIRPLPTIAVGAVGGLIVGMTSAGSGSLIIVALLTLYPALKTSELVGTDLVQAVPLVASAAIAHVFYGDFQLGLTIPLLVGAIPGVIAGSLVSSRAPGGIIRRALAVVLLASGLKLVGASTTQLSAVLLVVAVLGPLLWMWARKAHGLTALARSEQKALSQI